jgi:hypothetical protein
MSDSALSIRYQRFRYPAQSDITDHGYRTKCPPMDSDHTLYAWYGCNPQFVTAQTIIEKKRENLTGPLWNYWVDTNRWWYKIFQWLRGFYSVIKLFKAKPSRFINDILANFFYRNSNYFEPIRNSQEGFLINYWMISAYRRYSGKGTAEIICRNFPLLDSQ